MKLFRIISDGIQKVCNILAASILGIITIVYFTNIVQRYIVGQGYHGNEELTRYGTIWMVFICGVILTKLDEHLNVSILENALKGIPHKIIKFIQRFVMLAFYIVMAYISLGFVQVGARQTSPNIGIPMNYVYLIFPVCFILMTVQVIFLALDDLTKKPERLGGNSKANPLPGADNTAAKG